MDIFDRNIEAKLQRYRFSLKKMKTDETQKGFTCRNKTELTKEKTSLKKGKLFLVEKCLYKY